MNVIFFGLQFWKHRRAVSCFSVTKSRLTLTSWTAAHLVPLSSPISWSFLKFMSIELVILSHHLILCHPLCLLPSVFPSIKVFTNELAFHIRWPKYWSISFSISPSKVYLGLISLRIDFLILLSKGLRTSHVTQSVKNLPAMQNTWVWFLGLEDPLKKEVTTHTSILPWRISWMRSLAGYSPWDSKNWTLLSD